MQNPNSLETMSGQLALHLRQHCDSQILYENINIRGFAYYMFPK